MDLLGDSDSVSNNGNDTLKVNERFKARYEHNERRKLLEKGKMKYGDALNDQSPQSSSSEDDSEAELLNPKVEKKFLQVLTAIKNNDPMLKNTEKPIFDDDDFNTAQEKHEKKGKAFTLKDQIRKEALKKMKTDSDDSDDSQSQDDKKKSKLFKKIGVPLKDEEDQIKR